MIKAKSIFESKKRKKTETFRKNCVGMRVKYI